MPSTSRKRRQHPNTNIPAKKPREDKLDIIQPENDANYFDRVPDDAMNVIMKFIPITQWPFMERVNRQFQRAVVANWRTVRDGNLPEFIKRGRNVEKKSAYDRREILFGLLDSLVNRSPMLQYLKGFAPIVKSLDLRTCRLLAHFMNLVSVKFCGCHIPPRFFAQFMATSGSRGVLKEVALCGSLRFTSSLTASKATEQRRAFDGLLASAVANEPGRPNLKLKKLCYCGNNCCEGVFFNSLDVSELEILSVANSQIHPSHLVNLLERCRALKTLDITMSDYHPIDVLDQPYLATVNRDVLLAIGSIPAPNLSEFLFNGCRRDAFDEDTDFVNALTQLGRGHPITNLSIMGVCKPAIVNVIADNFIHLKDLCVDISECWSSILVRLVSTLRGLDSLRFYSTLTQSTAVDASVINAVLSQQKQLIELNLHTPVVTPQILEGLIILPELKKLHVGGRSVANKTLIKWADAFGSRLELLRMPQNSLSDAGVVVAMKKLPNIRNLDLRGAKITDLSLRAIAGSCPNLEVLRVEDCKQITVNGIVAIRNSCEKLKEVDTTNTKINQKDLILCMNNVNS